MPADIPGGNPDVISGQRDPPFHGPEDFNPVWKLLKAKGELKAPAEPGRHHLIYYVGCYSYYTN